MLGPSGVTEAAAGFSTFLEIVADPKKYQAQIDELKNIATVAQAEASKNEKARNEAATLSAKAAEDRAAATDAAKQAAMDHKTAMALVADANAKLAVVERTSSDAKAAAHAIDIDRAALDRATKEFNDYSKRRADELDAREDELDAREKRLNDAEKVLMAKLETLRGLAA